jgi:hypothetical protein
VLSATTTTAASKRRGWFLMLTVYTTQTSRSKESEGGFCHLHWRVERLSEPFAF